MSLASHTRCGATVLIVLVSKDVVYTILTQLSRQWVEVDSLCRMPRQLKKSESPPGLESIPYLFKGAEPLNERVVKAIGKEVSPSCLPTLRRVHTRQIELTRLRPLQRIRGRSARTFVRSLLLDSASAESWSDMGYSRS